MWIWVLGFLVDLDWFVCCNFHALSFSFCPFFDILHCLPRTLGVPLESVPNLVGRTNPCKIHATHIAVVRVKITLALWINSYTSTSGLIYIHMYMSTWIYVHIHLVFSLPRFTLLCAMLAHSPQSPFSPHCLANLSIFRTCVPTTKK